MKILDKLLKALKTNRNTFFAFILILISIYILVDRITEFCLIAFTGIAYEYWGPIAYTLAFACITFAYNLAIPSKFINSVTDKIQWFYTYYVVLYVLIISMISEWLNELCWLGLLSLPGYDVIATEFAFLIRPALSAIAIALPLTTWPKIFQKIHSQINETNLMLKSIKDYGGISLEDTTIGWGPYTNELVIGVEKTNGAKIKLPEIRRYESTMVVGISGAGKTTLIFEPFVAQDINKKHFFRETSKTLAIAGLRTGIASLNAPYDNTYLNKNFSLNMLKPVESKKSLFKAYFKKMTLDDSGSNLIFKNLGITYMSPDYETIGKIKTLCDNFSLGYNIIDPSDPASAGLNPFSFEDPVKTALLISTILKGFYTDKNPEIELAYRENLSNQIIENLSILLKVIYPKLNSGKLPTLNDMLKLLNNFSLIEKMCKILEKDKDLSKKYENQISYFKKNFFTTSPNKDEMEKLVSIPMAQIDTLLRHPGVKQILCNRTNNVNYDDVLNNGDICLVCTRRGELGENAHKAFGIYFLLLMQYSVLRRPGTERSRVPHFLYIDEFPDFLCKSTEAIFTVYRKYRIATIISAQNLDQLKAKGEKLGNTIISNCANKMVFGNNSPDDNEWWAKEMGEKREWTVDKKSYDFAKDEYKNEGKVSLDYKQKFKSGKIQGLGFKNCAFKIRNLNGKIVNGVVKLDFLPSEYNEKQKIKNYDFKKYTSGISEEESTKFNILTSLSNKNPLAQTHFDEIDQITQDNDNGPIKLDTTNLNFDINNNDAITFTFKKTKNNKKV